MATYCNPIKKRGDFPDPFVLRYNGRYYLYCTNEDVRCWSSEDLVNWTLAGPTVPEDEFLGLMPYAPEVSYWNGSFYMYTSPHGRGHYVLKSDSPTGPFRKISGNVGHNIDFSVFIDDDGQWYIYWADLRGIVGCKMNSPTEFGKEVVTGACLHGWTEGPFVVKKDGKYHLTYTGNHFMSKGYRIHAAIADHPLGPYREDPHNPVIVRTEGDVVGLGHSSTVLGPDLHTYYIVYHNLNPDITRDLNIDPIVFTPKKAYVLGPTATPRPAPALPRWQRPRYELQKVKGQFAEDILLPAAGAAEWNFAACANTGCYGISFTGAEGFRLEFDRRDNSVSVSNEQGPLVKEKLLEDYSHEALHCVRLEYGTGLTVYIDNLLRLRSEVSPGGCGVSYYADGDLMIGSATAQETCGDQLRYPVPCDVPGDRSIRFDLAERGKCQFLALGCTGIAGAIRVDNREILPHSVDRKNGLAYYRGFLEAGTHLLQAEAVDAETISISEYSDGDGISLSVSNLGPYDKTHGTERKTDLNMRVNLNLSEQTGKWQAGVIFRADHLADGGVGDNKLEGTNFFVGYRVCVAEGKIQLWKHRYDETLLQEAACTAKENVVFEVSAVGNCISVYHDGSRILSCQDPEPIVCGYAGFHARNCIITAGTIN